MSIAEFEDSILKPKNPDTALQWLSGDLSTEGYTLVDVK